MSIGLAGCGVELLTTTAIQGELQAQNLKAINRQLGAVREMSAETTIQRALSTYHAEKGHYPASLEELVPSYMPSVPKQADGTPYGYDPATGTLLTGTSAAAPAVSPAADDAQKVNQIRSAVARYGQKTGRYPTSLYALVPEYLPELPATSSGQDFVYYPQNGAVYHPAQLQLQVAVPPQTTALRPVGPVRAPGVGAGGPMAEVMTGIAIQNQLNSMSNAGTGAAQGHARRSLDATRQQHDQQQQRVLNDMGL
jgi:hypothetical protein